MHMLGVMYVMQVSVQKRWQNDTGGRSSITKKVYCLGPNGGWQSLTSPSDDIHIPTLTVAQTLDFALSTKTPGKRLPGISGKEFNAKLRRTFLQMFNILHTEKTLVGDAFVRGVSGGERKRVSIAEMMASRAHVTCWDNSTRKFFSFDLQMAC